MSYKKPQIVARSAAKQTFVAGCPTNTGTPNTRTSHGCFLTRCQIETAK